MEESEPTMTTTSPLLKIPFISRIVGFASTSVICPLQYATVTSTWAETVHEYPGASAEKVWRNEESTLRPEKRKRIPSSKTKRKSKHVDPVSDNTSTAGNNGDNDDDDREDDVNNNNDSTGESSDDEDWFSPIIPGVAEQFIRDQGENGHGPNIRNEGRRAVLHLLKHACSRKALIRVVDVLYRAKVVSVYSSFESNAHYANSNSNEWQSQQNEHTNTQPSTPLTVAASCGLVETCRLLIEKFNTDPMQPASASNATKALHYACQSGDLETVEFLFQQTKKGYDEMFENKALSSSNFFEGNFINAHVPLGTALTRAIASKSLPVVEFLLRKTDKSGAGASPVWPNPDRWSPMDVAVLFEDPEDFVLAVDMSKLLFKAGAPLCYSTSGNNNLNGKKTNKAEDDDDNNNDGDDLDDHDLPKKNKRSTSKRRDSSSGGKRKRRRNPKNHPVDEDGESVDEHPEDDDHYPDEASLSDEDSFGSGDDGSSGDDSGEDDNENGDDEDDDENDRLIQLHISPEEHMSPLLLAAEVGNVKLIDWLLQTGADPTAKNGMGQTCLHICNLRRHDDCVKYLVQSGCVDINAKDYAGDDAFSAARKRQHLEMVSHFKDHAFQFVNHAMQSTMNQQRQQQQLNQDLQNDDGSLSNAGFSFDRDQVGDSLADIAAAANRDAADADQQPNSNQEDDDSSEEEEQYVVTNFTNNNTGNNTGGTSTSADCSSSSSIHQQASAETAIGNISAASSDDTSDENDKDFHLYSKGADEDSDDEDIVVQGSSRPVVDDSDL